MSNQLSNPLLAEMFGQSSSDPYLMLVTLTHSSFSNVYLVGNTVDVVSRGNTYIAFPMNIVLPSDDGEASREVTIDFDNVSLFLIAKLRSIVTPIICTIEMVLASDLDSVQTSIDDLKVRSITYTKQRVSAKLYMDSFLNVELTSEKYTPNSYPGLF